MHDSDARQGAPHFSSRASPHSLQGTRRRACLSHRSPCLRRRGCSRPRLRPRQTQCRSESATRRGRRRTSPQGTGCKSRGPRRLRTSPARSLSWGVGEMQGEAQERTAEARVSSHAALACAARRADARRRSGDAGDGGRGRVGARASRRAWTEHTHGNTGKYELREAPGQSDAPRRTCTLWHPSSSHRCRSSTAYTLLARPKNRYPGRGDAIRVVAVRNNVSPREGSPRGMRPEAGPASRNRRPGGS